MTSSLTDHILRHLAATGADAHPWSFLVLAALEGDAALATYLASDGAPVKPAASAPAPATTAEPPGAFVGAVTVQGFRGVGPATTLPLHAGPGLTLIVEPSSRAPPPTSRNNHEPYLTSTITCPLGGPMPAAFRARTLMK